MNPNTRTRAQRCLLGLLVGDALGGQVEFMSPEQIATRFPRGVREMQGGGPFNLTPGQVTDDGELALSLAQSITRAQGYDRTYAFTSYQAWIESNPVDCGYTIGDALRKIKLNPESQANGALMRLAPIAILGHNHLDSVGLWAAQDAALTHPNEACASANIVFATVCATAIARGYGPRDLAEIARRLAKQRLIANALDDATSAPPADPVHQMGWVRHAVQIAFFELLHAPNFEEGIVHAISLGGDTDTNAAITGMLLGCVYPIPERWTNSVLNCTPDRPEYLWPKHAPGLVDTILAL